MTVLLDGYPRNSAQVKIAEKEQMAPSCVLQISVPKEVLKKRMMDRKRQDDTAEVIKNRISIYEKETKKLLKSYKKIVVQLDGNQEPKKVLEDAINVLSKKKMLG